MACNLLVFVLSYKVLTTRIRFHLKTQLFISVFKKFRVRTVSYSYRFPLSTRIRSHLKTQLLNFVFKKNSRPHGIVFELFSPGTGSVTSAFSKSFVFVCPHEKGKTAFLKSSNLESVFEKLRFRLSFSSYTCGR